MNRIVSGGQTGADRAALRWAIENGIGHGGWCPRGRLAEDGGIPDCFLLEETPTRSYAERTEWNVRDSDATVIISLSPVLSGGTLLTRGLARKWRRPCLLLSRLESAQPGEELRQFVEAHFVRTLNVAGPRESTEPGIGDFVREVLIECFS